MGVNWSTAFIVTKTFDTMIDGLGSGVTFSVYAGFCLIAALFAGNMFSCVGLSFPETKGRSLEAMEKYWQNGEVFDEQEEEAAAAAEPGSDLVW